jgi:hypothetical protein
MISILKNLKIKVMSLGIVLAGMISAGIFMQSCSSEDDVYLEENKGKVPDALLNYFNSEDYSILSKSFNINVTNIDFNNLVIENFDDVDVEAYYLPVKKGQHIVGRLCIVSKAEGEIYKSLYEDRSELQKTDEGKIAIYTSQGLFVADFKYKKESNGLYLLRLNDVGNRIPRLKSGAEWPNPSDGWWTCTTNCYAYAKEVCGDNAQCDFLCDIANILGHCTISMAVACAAYCV